MKANKRPSNRYKPKCRSWILVFSRKERKDRKAYRDGGLLLDFQARPIFWAFTNRVNCRTERTASIINRDSCKTFFINHEIHKIHERTQKQTNTFSCVSCISWFCNYLNKNIPSLCSLRSLRQKKQEGYYSTATFRLSEVGFAVWWIDGESNVNFPWIFRGRYIAFFGV